MIELAKEVLQPIKFVATKTVIPQASAVVLGEGFGVQLMTSSGGRLEKFLPGAALATAALGLAIRTALRPPTR